MKNRNPIGIAVLLSLLTIVLLFLFLNGIGFSGMNFFQMPKEIFYVQNKLNRSENTFPVLNNPPDVRRVSTRRSKNFQTNLSKSDKFNVIGTDIFKTSSSDMGITHVSMSNSINLFRNSARRKHQSSENNQIAFPSISVKSLSSLISGNFLLRNTNITKTDILAMQKTSLPTGPTDPGTGSLPDSPLDPGTGSLPDTPLDPYGVPLNDSYIYLLVFAGIYFSAKLLRTKNSNQKSLHYE